MRLLALLLIFALLLTTVLFSSCQNPEPPEGEDTSEEATTEEATTEELETIEKSPCYTTIDANFEDNRINVYIQPFANEKQYTVDDFKDIGCIEVKNAGYYSKKNDCYYLWLYLTLDKHSKQNVLDMMKILDMRQDVVRAEPNWLFELDMLPNDPLYHVYDE
jgi:hypothetical protein